MRSFSEVEVKLAEIARRMPKEICPKETLEFEINWWQVNKRSTLLSHYERKSTNDKGTSVTFAKGDLLNRAEITSWYSKYIIYIETCTHEMRSRVSCQRRFAPKGSRSFCQGLSTAKRRLAELNEPTECRNGTNKVQSRQQKYVFTLGLLQFSWRLRDRSDR